MSRFLIFLIAATALAQQIDYPRQVRNKPSLDSREYQFTLTNGRQFTADLSASGAKTITFLAPYACPSGVSGGNAYHKLRISGGTGTAEVVLITGGTCTSGAAGTLSFTTANTHSGSYTITSATAGIQEAVHAAAPVGHVLVPSGSHTIYATISIRSTASATRRVSVSGVHRAASVIVADSTLSGPGFLVSDTVAQWNKFESGQYGISNLTLDFRSAPTSDVIQLGTETDVGLGHSVPIIHHVNIWGGARFIYALTGGKLWVTDSYMNKDTAAADGIYMDVTSGGGISRGGSTLKDLEIGTESATPGTGIAIHIYCSTTEAAGCNWTNLDMLNVLGQWKHALVAEAPAIAVDGIPAGMYVTANMFIAEAHYDSHVAVFKNSAFNQMKDCWLSNMKNTGGAAAVYLENATEMLFSGNYFFTGASAAHIQMNGGSRHFYGDNRFAGASYAFGFDGTYNTTASTVGFNHYNAGIFSQSPQWIAFTTTGATNTLPVVSPFHVTFAEGQTSPIRLENIEAGAANPVKSVYVDATGVFRILNNAGTAYVLSVSNAGIVEPGVVTFANLPSASGGPAILGCSDCAATSGADNTCVGSGGGALAVRMASSWRCFAPVGP